VRDDVVERPLASVEIRNIALLKLDVLKSKVRNRLIPFDDPTSRQIDAKKRTLRQRVGHRNDICAVTAAKFQNTALLNRRGLHAEKCRKGRQPIRMRLDMGQTWISDFVVSVGRLVIHGCLVKGGSSEK
jgi:hypothetical protein